MGSALSETVQTWDLRYVVLDQNSQKRTKKGSKRKIVQKRTKRKYSKKERITQSAQSAQIREFTQKRTQKRDFTKNKVLKKVSLLKKKCSKEEIHSKKVFLKTSKKFTH